MKILITQREMQNFGGSQLYAAEVARSLVARGHEVALYCPKPGRISKLVSPSGVAVRDRLGDLPWRPDVIHGQQHLPLMAALARFPETPAVHVWHGARPWVETVPLHPRIRYYVATSARMAPQIAADAGVPDDRVVTIPNFVDMARYSHVREIADRPRRAVLYGHGGFHPAELRVLEEACERNGLSLDKIGYPYGNPRPRPEYFLPDYDIAFAIGRCALEAMACGVAVIPVVPQLAGHMITTGTLDAWSEANYAPRYFTSADRFGAEWLRQELAGWDPAAVSAVTQEVRARFGLEEAMDAYEALYERTIAAGPSMAPDGEFGSYLEWLARDVDDMWSRSDEHTAERQAQHDTNVRLQTELERSTRQVRFLMETLLASKGIVTDPRANPAPGEVRGMIARSGLFDREWYLRIYPEVAEAGMDPLEHYLLHGAFEGRNPSPDFDSARYMEANPHLRGLAMSPLEHMLRQMAVVDPAHAPEEPVAEALPESEPKAARSAG